MDGGHLNGRLIRHCGIPALLLGLRLRRLVLVRRLGMLRLRGRLLDDMLRRLLRLVHLLRLRCHLGLERDHVRRLLVDGRGGVQGISCGLCGRRVGVEAVLRVGTAARGCRKGARAALHAGVHARTGVIGYLQRQALDALARDLVVLRLHRALGWVRTGVHGRHSRVILLSHVIRVLGDARRPLEHLNTWMLLRLRMLRLIVRVHLRMLRMLGR